MIALIDFGAGNLRSVHKALIHVGAEVRLAPDPEVLADADAVVLPGVGAFDDCLGAMARQGLVEACRDYVKTGKPFLGICVGYQALFERSEEGESKASGLCLMEGNVVRFSERPGLKIPQIGWNQIAIRQPDCPLFTGIPEGSHVYFVHSYFPRPADPSVVACESEHGDTFCAAVWRDNVFGTQFHPEKSQAVGLKMLRNFVNLATSPCQTSSSTEPVAGSPPQ